MDLKPGLSPQAAPDPIASEAVGVYRPEHVAIDHGRILRLQGYRDMGKIRPVIRDTAIQIARQAEEMFEAVFHYRTLGVAHQDGELLRLADGTEFCNPAFPKTLGGAERVTVTIMTLGEELDRRTAAAVEAFEPVEALFLETAGWMGVEVATRAFVGFLQAQVRGEGLRLTRRMGPGYSYKRPEGQEIMWPLEEQRKLFALFNETALPVRLLESCAMMPKMSRSGLYGLVRAGTKGEAGARGAGAKGEQGA